MIKPSLFSVIRLATLFFQNNFSTLKTVENVENFLSKKCDFRCRHRGRREFTHKFSTLPNKLAVEKSIYSKNPLFRFLPQTASFLFFDGFF